MRTEETGTVFISQTSFRRTPVGTSQAYTVWLKSLNTFSVNIHIFNHYNSNFARISDFYRLVIGTQKSEI